jgi:hypothetical protein
MGKKAFGIFLIVVMLAACGGEGKGVDIPGSGGQIGQLLPPVPDSLQERQVAGLTAYREEMLRSLALSPPVMVYPDSALREPYQRLAQELALRHDPFTKDVWERESRSPLRTEIMEVRKLEKLETQRIGLECHTGQCYQVVLYNYFHHTTTAALVDVFNKKVLQVIDRTEEPTALNPLLRDLARKVVLSNPEIQEKWGPKLEEAPVQFRDCKCERSLHLCVNVIFSFKNQALWTLVDLDDFQLLGYKWGTEPGGDPSFVLTERSLQNEYIMEYYCGVDNTLKKGDWELVYQLTSSDGMEVKNARYKGKEALHSAKIVDWHVSYTYKKGFGYSDAMGCPMFSSAANVASRAPEVENIVENGRVTGFALIMDFRSPVWPLPCNYRYQNRYEFYDDGRFRICGINMGQGCGVTGWYRPVFRIDLASGNDPHLIEQWQGGAWKRRDQEFWHEQVASTAYSPEGYLFKIATAESGGYYLQPSRGKFAYDGRGDNAFSYFVTDKQEGAADLPTFGPCCNDDYRQGPEAFLEPAEELEGKSTVIWYVPQMANNNQAGQQHCWTELIIRDGQQSYQTWPGIVGPMFVPISTAQ